MEPIPFVVSACTFSFPMAASGIVTVMMDPALA